MAKVTINVDSYHHGDVEVSFEVHERMMDEPGELEGLIDKAVARTKEAYGFTGEGA